jgi:hypothetical protein
LNNRRVAIWLGILGLIVIFLAWVWADIEFLLAVLTNLGIGLLLFSGLSLLLSDYLVRQEQQIEERLQESEDRVNTSLADLGEQTRELFRQRHEEDQRAVDLFLDNVTAASTAEMLHRAYGLQALSADGVRVLVPGTFLRLRFSSVKADAVEVELQEWDGTVLHKYEWADMAPAELLMAVAADLVTLGRFPGEAVYDGTAIMESLHDAVELVIQAKYGDEVTPPLGPLYEVVNRKWAVTDVGVECLTEKRTIKVANFDGEEAESTLATQGEEERSLLLDAIDLARERTRMRRPSARALTAPLANRSANNQGNVR